MFRKYVICFLVIGLLFAFGLFLIGCGSSGSSPSPSPTPSTGTVSITGRLNTGLVASVTVLSNGMKAQASAQAAIPNYTVVAVSNSTGRVYYPDAVTDGSGNFRVGSLPSGESFYLEILDSNNNFVSPVSFGSDTGKLYMTITPESYTTMELGAIAYDVSKHVAAPTLEPTTFLEESVFVSPKSGETMVPKGAGNLGKGSDAQFFGSYDENKMDGDKDGVPNFFDADNNGDLIVDEFDGRASREVLSSGSSKINYAMAFTNLKIEFADTDTFKPAYTNFNIAIHIAPKLGYTISSARLIAGPSWIDSAKIQDTQLDVADPTSYAAAVGHLWNSLTPAYKLWEGVSHGGGMPADFLVFLNSVRPSIEVRAGDALTFLVNFTDGSSEKVVKMINFVYTDIPKVYQYNVGGGWVTAPSPHGGSIATATTSEVQLRWYRPKDESNNDVVGSRFTYEYWVNPGVGVSEETIIPYDSGAGAYVEGSYDFAGKVAAGSEIHVGICSRSTANDNAAQNLTFTRSGW